MKNIKQYKRSLRRPKGHMSTFGVNLLHQRNPWVTACWSAAFPGFGHILVGNYLKGFLLVTWEIIININSKINLAIIYSFTGRFELAKNTLNERWAILYCAVFVYGLWDSHRLSIEYNKLSVLADRENSSFLPFKIGFLAMNALDKRNPWLAAAWSVMAPGLGQLYTQRIVFGFFTLIWWIVIANFSNVPYAIHLSLLGDFSRATAVNNPSWLLFMPSIWCFSIYDSYISCIEYNKVFETEQSRFLKENYQDEHFEMPI